jgi:protein TonB
VSISRRRNPAIEALRGFALPAGLVPAAGERPAPTSPAPRRRPWPWAATLLLHGLILAAILFVRARPELTEDQAPASVDVVLDHGGHSQTTAPPAPVHGPPLPAQSAPPPPPPKAQPAPSPKPAPPLPRAHSAPPVHSAPPAPHYAVMQGMSFGQASPLMPQPPQPNFPHAMNFNPPQSDAQAVAGPELTIKGHIGADWQAALNKWVNEHKYYPQAAAEQNQQGDVEIEFTVDRQGNITGLHLLSGSGSVFLDQAWLGLFRGVQLPPFPPGTKDDHITVDATMHYIIEN